MEAKPRVLPCSWSCLRAGPAHRSLRGSTAPPTAPSSSQPARSPPMLQFYQCNCLCPNKVSAPGRAYLEHELQAATEQVIIGHYRSCKSCKSCGTDAEVSVWQPLISSNCFAFQCKCAWYCLHYSCISETAAFSS